MNQRLFCLAGGIIFSTVALLHAARIVFQWEALIGGWQVPEWVSWIAIFVAGFLGYKGLTLGTKN